MTSWTRGVLYPARLPEFHRVPAPPDVADAVRWFWIPSWDIAPGRSSRQYVVAFPGTNLVVEGASVDLAGPSTRRSHRDLRGRGWAVGALLKPAAVPAFTADPARLRDRQVPIDAPELLRTVTAAMDSDGDGATRRSGAVEAFGRWLVDRLPPLDDAGRTANAMAELIDGDAAVLRLEDVADRLNVSVRTLHRLAASHVGVSPAVMIRRRRLQEAAERLREGGNLSLAELAAELGYADHAHLTRDFRRVLGVTPSGYRRHDLPPEGE